MGIVSESNSQVEREEPTDWQDPESVIARVKSSRQKAARQLADWNTEYQNNARFVAGWQWTEAESSALEENKRLPVVFNRVGPIISAICGQQVNNRQEPRYLPMEVSDAGRAEAWNQIVRWVRENADSEDQESSAFRDLLIGGVGWTQLRVEYDTNPAGMICEQRIDPRRVRWDPKAERKNLADARWVQCDYWYDRQTLRALWPHVEELDIAPDAMGTRRAGTPHDADNDWRYENNAQELDLYQDQYRVVHHEEWCLHATFEIADVDGSMQTLTQEQWDTLVERVGEGNLPPVNRSMRRVYYHAWTVGATVLESGEAPLQKDFTYAALTGLRDEEKLTWYGLVRAMCDPQRYANKIFSTIMYALSHGAKGGLMVERDALDNPRQFEEQWANPAGVAYVKPGAIAGGKIMPKPPPQLPPELINMMTYAIDAIRDVGGVNIELLGQQPEHVQPGMIEAMRTKAGLVMLAPWFDALRLYLRRKGRVYVEAVNKFIADGRIVRVMGPMGPQALPLVRDEAALEYDVMVEEATSARDMRERTFAAITQLLPMSVQLGVEPPLEVMDYMPLPEALREKWKQAAAQAKSAPKQPPPEVQLEMVRSQNAQTLQQAKAHADLQLEQMKMQAEMQKEAAQAQSQRFIESLQLAQDAERHRMEMRLEESKTAMEARLTLFETLLKASVEQQQAAREEDRAERESQREAMRADREEQAQAQSSAPDPRGMFEEFRQGLLQDVAQLINNRPFEVEYGADGRIAKFNGRAVRRDGAGRMQGLH